MFEGAFAVSHGVCTSIADVPVFALVVAWWARPRAWGCWAVWVFVFVPMSSPPFSAFVIGKCGGVSDFVKLDDFFVKCNVQRQLGALTQIVSLES